MSTTPTLNQVRFRIRTDTGGVGATPTWADAENTSVSYAVETTFRIRFSVNNTGTAAGAGPQILRVSKNAGAYTAVTTSTGATLGAQSDANASTSADEVAIATGGFRLTAGTGTALAGIYDETGSATLSITNGFYTELEYGLILKTAGAVPGDTFDFRVYNSTTAYTTYTQTPRITVLDPNKALLANDVSSASSVTTAKVAETNASAPANSLITSFASGTPRNDHTGEGGVRIGVGTTDVPVSWLGMPVLSGNTGRRNIRIYSDPAHTLLRTISIDLTGETAGAMAWVKIAPLTLLANGYYSLLLETYASDGNFWPGGGTTTMQSSIVDIDAVYSTAIGGGITVAFADIAYVGIDLGWDADTEDDLLANDVKSNSSVTQPALQQVHNPLANDVKSNSSVGQPAVKSLHGLLANDVKSNSSVGQPAAVIGRGLLANDVISGSSVSNPALTEIAGATALQANDVKSNSSVGQPAVKQLHGLQANDVLSPSSVTRPTQFRQLQGLAANDVLSPSSVSNPALVHVVGSSALLANDVISTSSVSQPAALIRWNILANDIASTPSVGQPGLHLLQGLLANDVVSPSSVSVPLFGEIAAGSLLAENVSSASSVGNPGLHLLQGLLANDVVSASSLSQPMLDRPEVVVPPGTELGGGGPAYGRGYPRKRWEELLRRLEEERQAALRRANAFPSNKDRQKARKAARAASEAIAAALAAADEAAEVAHAGAITRSLEAAAEAKGIAEYLAQMKAAREAAIEMELDDDDEAVLMMVA